MRRAGGALRDHLVVCGEVSVAVVRAGAPRTLGALAGAASAVLERSFAELRRREDVFFGRYSMERFVGGHRLATRRRARKSG